MIEYELIKKSLINNLPNTILTVVIFLTLNGKLNKLLIKEGITEVKVAEIDNLESDFKALDKRVSSLEICIAGHLGDAYIKEEEND